MTWDQPSTAVAEAEAALFAEAHPSYRCACSWATPSDSDCPDIQHQFHRHNCQATWTR